MTSLSEAFNMGQRIAQDPHVRAAAGKIARFAKARLKQRSKRSSKLAIKRGMAIDSIGQPPGTATSKKDGMVTFTPTLLERNTLYTVDATALVTDVGATGAGQQRLDINKRQRNIAFVSGIRYRQYWRNTAGSPRLIRWALVAPKNGSVTPAGFFRSYETSRDQDFDSTLSSIEKQTNPISRDKYTVFYEGKLFLAPNQDDTSYADRQNSNLNYVDKWLPIGRQLQFNDDSDQDCEDKIFVVWWATNYMAGTTTSSPNDIETQTSIITHFRDPLEMMMSKGGYKRVNKRRYPTSYRNVTNRVH